ncbi:organic hydroperoxide reductase OsmC/OhrA [Pseudomonas duriflava]|uniref:Organic hydroperoxide reductase OsmC/OhrA n=1 Tax=Pseudomonas duriflava TaxID=459528 RepID=A0A562QPF9_9PSED|nr:OsmC family protein [Pseudomonas duriflava]TWI58563.1 organic hydroperoxide reductase OsmC/OhrA [Pseudomonas duriflava]
MAGKQHTYHVRTTWTGNRGQGTEHYRAYDRDHVIQAEGKPDLSGSSDPAFRGNPARWSPEDLLLASVSACHKLWYLHLCAEAGIIITAYEDYAEGRMEESPEGGRFTQITLRPQVTVRSGSDHEQAQALHHEAHRQCFIANSLNVPVMCEGTVVTEA